MKSSPRQNSGFLKTLCGRVMLSIMPNVEAAEASLFYWQWVTAILIVNFTMELAKNRKLHFFGVKIINNVPPGDIGFIKSQPTPIASSKSYMLINKLTGSCSTWNLSISETFSWLRSVPIPTFAINSQWFCYCKSFRRFQIQSHDEKKAPTSEYNITI